MLKGKLEGLLFKSIFFLSQPDGTQSFFNVLFGSRNSGEFKGHIFNAHFKEKKQRLKKGGEDRIGSGLPISQIGRSTL